MSIFILLTLLACALCAPTAAATPAMWEGTSPAYEYTDAQCTSGKSAAPVSTTTKSVRSSATTACLSVTAGEPAQNQFYRQTCVSGATTYTQQSCDSADCGVCSGSLMTYTIKKTATGAAYCVATGGRFFKGDAPTTTTAGDFNLASAPCFQAPTIVPGNTGGISIQTEAATTITSSPIAFAAAVVVAAAMAR